MFVQVTIYKQIKDMLIFLSAFRDIKLFYTKSHIGTTSNELADRLAKAATKNQVIDVEVKTSFDSLKSLLKRKSLTLWQAKWNDPDSKGRFTYNLISTVREDA
ncbi:hypothetical protein X975_04064, partial [Stegodyphus mimosarum]